jgi:predicted dehydrogenase
VHVAVITSRNQEHAPQAIAALRAGKHVFVEKPMALTEKECRDLLDAVEKSGCQLTVGFNRRFAPFYTPLKKHLAGRSSPAVVNCRINSPGISGSYWMADPAIGGAILGEACHFVDLMYWLLDEEPLSVSAYSLPTGKDDPIGENNIAAAFRFADGSVGSLTYCTVGSKTSGGERVEAFTQGLGISTEDFKRLGVNGSIAKSNRNFFAEKGYDAQMQSFIDAIRKGVAPAVTIRDGVRATIGCLKILESARTGLPCQIDLEAVLHG